MSTDSLPPSFFGGLSAATRRCDRGACTAANLSRRATLAGTPDFRRIMFVDSGRGEAGSARGTTPTWR